jgi:hypothetical protein
MEELQISVDENNYEPGILEILKNIRATWIKENIEFKVNHIFFRIFFFSSTSIFFKR